MTNLKSIKYSLFESFNNKEWILEKCLFEQINLIVGKNASGKTRVLNTIVELANLLGYRYDLTRQVTVKIATEFEIDNNLVTYEIEYGRGIILGEKILTDNKLILERSDLGEVERIFDGRKFKQKRLHTSDLMLAGAYDGIENIIKKLLDWRDSFSYYPFAGDLGQFQYEINKDIPRAAAFSVSKFIAGRERFRTDFNDLIIANLASIGYEISEIGIERRNHNGDVPEGAIYVIEEGSSVRIYQYEMSQGMFRALSLIIQINYTILAQNTTCIVIDDIGEGLDHERAKKLIALLIQKSEDSNIQLIMTTNDRFVMNTVPLKYWTVLDRKGHKVSAYNYQNHKELFDEFEDMGLSNFDFFSSEFYRNGFEELDQSNQV